MIPIKARGNKQFRGSHRPSLRDFPLDPYDMRLPLVNLDRFHKEPFFCLGRGGRTASMITADSPLALRLAVARLALWFRREFHYDFVPYEADSHPPDCQIFAWADDDREHNRQAPLIGAAGFDVEDRLPARPWMLGWAWFHPYARRQGYLSHAWPLFRERFGDFLVRFPLSEPMQAFLAKVDPEAIARTRAAVTEATKAPEAITEVPIL
jgi:hypothetical protein